MNVNAPTPSRESVEVFLFLKYFQPQRGSRLSINILEDNLHLNTRVRKVITFSATVLAIFREVPSLEIVKEDLYATMVKVKKCLKEIQERKRAGKTLYDPTDFSQTLQEMIEKNQRIGPTAFFEQLSRYSYGTLPFPSELLAYPTLAPKALSALDAERNMGFRTLVSRLEREEEHKGAPEKASFLGKKGGRADEENFALAKLLYNGAALITGEEKRKRIFFRDLLATWANGSEEREHSVRSVFRSVGLGRWSSHQGKVLEEFSQVKRGGTFQDFLTNCTIENIEERFGVHFSLAALDVLQREFREEQVRSDVAYFMAQLPELLLRMDWKGWEASNPPRPSQSLLCSLQILFFYKQIHGVSPEKLAPLFEMILFRDSSWKKPMRIPGFQESDPRHVATGESYPFSIAWRGIESCLCTLLRTEELEWTSPEVERLLHEPQLFPFLVFLQGHTQLSSSWSGIFESFRKDPKVIFNISMMYRFCEATTSFNPPTAVWFSRDARELISAVQAHRSDFRNFAPVCFEPALRCNLEKIRGQMQPIVADFFRSLEEYELSEKTLQGLLQQRMSEEEEYHFMLQLLKEDVQALGVAPPSEDFVSHVLTAKFGCELPSLEQRQEALAAVMQLHQKYSFSEIERFDLYLEILRLKVQRQELLLRKIIAFTEKLQALIPFLAPRLFFLLLIHHPEPPFEAFEELLSLRRAFTREDLQQLYLDQKKLRAFLEKAEEVLAPLKEPLPENDGKKLTHAFGESVLCPFQPLTDFLKIKDFDEFTWEEAHLATHWGQLKLTTRGEVYLNWNLNSEGVPEIFMMLYHPRERSAQSAFVLLNVKRDEFNLLSKEERDDFFNHLRLAWELVRHDDDINTLDVLSNPAAPKIAPELSQPILTFVQEVKIAYRSLFFPELAKQTSFDPFEVAASGRIYPIGRGSLLPSLLGETHPECYQPDGEIDPALFRKKTEGRQELPFPLHIMGIDGHPKEVPFFYEVRTEEDETEKASEVSLSFPSSASTQARLQYPPGEDVQRRFAIHNLILKSHAYRFERSRIREEERKEA